MNDIPIHFSAMLMCILVVFTMMGTVFDGEADTLSKYIVSTLMSVAAIVLFGVLAENTVQLIMKLT